MKQTLFINVYRSGVYHRQGKPHTCNMHGGDLYATRHDAIEAIEHDKGYITTAPVVVDLPALAYVNPEGSEPTPLSDTRRIVMSGQDSPGLLPLYHDSLETSEREAVEIQQAWERPAKAPETLSKAYKPTHGGYPTSARNTDPQPGLGWPYEPDAYGTEAAR